MDKNKKSDQFKKEEEFLMKNYIGTASSGDCTGLIPSGSTDSSEEFVHADFGWCPRHAGTDREFECTRFISSGQVCQTVQRLMADYGLHPEQGKVRRRKANGK